MSIPTADSVESADLSLDAKPRLRRHRYVANVAFWLGVAVSIWHLYVNTLGTLPTFLQNAVHYAGFSLLCVMYYAARGKAEERSRLQLGLDLGIGVIAAASAIFIVLMEDAIYARGVKLALPEWIAGGLLILSALEFTRRTTGWLIPAMIVLALSYVALWGGWLDNVFKFSGLSLETILFRSVFGDDGIFGNIALISSTFVFLFILFGAFLVRSGAGQFIIDFSRSLAGRFVGGPGFVAVFASGLTGTISGSAIANVASTGVITIPMMKKAGFPARFAAAVEASASTGGQIMPPIMGAGAFVMANYTQIPYPTIAAVSFLPAVLYFLSVAFYVRIQALKVGIKVEVDENTPSAWQVLKQGGPSFLVPIAVLIGLLIYGFSPTFAACIAILAVVVSSWFSPNRMGPRAIAEALAMGARNMVMTAILLCSIGLVINVIAMTGVGNTLSLMITTWAGNSLLLALVLIAGGALVLGMGLPVTAAYIVLATLSAPALYNLMAEAEVLKVLTSGQIAEEAKAMLTLLAPVHGGTIMNGPVSLEAARQIMAEIPADSMSLIRDQLVNPAALSAALLASHLIIFWFSQTSNVTPPVCLAAFTAAAIAGTKPMATGFEAFKIALGFFIVPLLFAYTTFPTGTMLETAEIFVFTAFGLYAFAATTSGYMTARLNPAMRILTGICCIALMWPYSLAIDIIGFAGLAAVYFANRRTARSFHAAAQTAA